MYVQYSQLEAAGAPANVHELFDILHEQVGKTEIAIGFGVIGLIVMALGIRSLGKTDSLKS